MLVDKPAGPTSHDMVAIARRALGTRAIGHAGTLDPFATGLLVLLVGRATRLARFVERQAKGYLAEAVFGVTTDTDDGTGQVLERRTPERWPDAQDVASAVAQLVGSQAQRPPAYSARRVAGRRGYELARSGQPVDLPAREITVHSAEVLGWKPPVLCFRVAVSAGTYVRALARDLGEALGCGAHLRSLRREWIGNLRVEEAVQPEALGPETSLLTPARLVDHLRAVPLELAEVEDVRHGRAVHREDASGEGALLRDGCLVAVAEAEDGAWQPRVVLGVA